MQVKKLSYLLRGVYAADTAQRGRGMFSQNDIGANKLIEVAPVIVLSASHRLLLDQTLLHDYIFEWGPSQQECCVALGCISLYNHSYASNCEYEMDYDAQIMRIKTVRHIKAGEELFINYNGSWNDGKNIWFDAQ